jgi:DNA-binding beta-propeller fold protein YncE
MSTLALRLAVVAIAAAPASVAWAEEQEQASRPRYVDRLRLPSRGDDFIGPRSVAADSHTGEVFVCDRNRHAVAIFDAQNRFDFEIEGGDRFRAPLDVAIDPDGRLILLAWREGRTRVLQLDFDGAWIGELELTTADEVVPDFVSVALSPDGTRVYLLEHGRLELWVATRDGTVRTTIDLAEDESDKERSETILGHVDAYGDTVLVAIPTFGRVLLFGPDGEPRGGVGLKGTAPCQSAFPMAAALDRNGDVLVLDKQRTVVTRWRVEGNRCLAEYFGIGRSPGALYLPDDLGLDARGRFVIGQGFEGRVQVYQDAP